MSKIIKQSVVSSTLSYVGVIVGFFYTLWLLPKAMTTGQIGIFRTVQDAALFMLPFALAGLRQSLLKFFPNFSEGKPLRAFITFILSAALLCYGIFTGFFFLFKDLILSIFEEKAPEIIGYTPIILGILFTQVYFTILEAYAYTFLKAIIPNFIKEVVNRVLTMALVAAYLFRKIDFDTTIYGLLIVYGGSLLLLVAYLTFLGRLKLHFNFKLLPFRVIRKLMKYGGITFIGSSSSVVVTKVDSLMVTSMLGPSSNGIYTTNFFIAVVIEMPRRIITQLAMPQISKAFANSNIRAIQGIYQATSLNQFLLGFLLLIGIWANLDSLYFMIPNGEAFRAGRYVVLFIGLSKLMDMLSSINGEIIILSKYYKFNIIALSLLAVLVVASNLIFIPILGLTGAAIASAISLLFFNLTKFLFIFKKLKIQPFSLSTLWVVLIGIVAYGVSLFLPRHPLVLLDILFRSVLISVIYIGLVLYFNISKEVDFLFMQLKRRFSGK